VLNRLLRRIGILRRKVYAFDFFNCLETCAWIRREARAYYNEGHEVHIVSAISPGLPLDSDEAYANMLENINVPYTKIWRVDHDPNLKVEVLRRIKADMFFDDDIENVLAAQAAGFSVVLTVPHPKERQASEVPNR